MRFVLAALARCARSIPPAHPPADKPGRGPHCVGRGMGGRPLERASVGGRASRLSLRPHHLSTSSSSLSIPHTLSPAPDTRAPSPKQVRVRRPCGKACMKEREREAAVPSPRSPPLPISILSLSSLHFNHAPPRPLRPCPRPPGHPGRRRGPSPSLPGPYGALQVRTRPRRPPADGRDSARAG